MSQTKQRAASLAGRCLSLPVRSSRQTTSTGPGRPPACDGWWTDHQTAPHGQASAGVVPAWLSPFRLARCPGRAAHQPPHRCWVWRIRRPALSQGPATEEGRTKKLKLSSHYCHNKGLCPNFNMQKLKENQSFFPLLSLQQTLPKF